MKMYSEMTKAEQAKLRSYEKAGNKALPGDPQDHRGQSRARKPHG